MENICIHKDLKSEFSKYINEDNEINEIDAQKASWKFGIYPSTSQIFEIHTCKIDENCLHNLEFHEYCLLIAIIKSEIDKPSGKTKLKTSKPPKKFNSRWDVFLGGACNPTTWRFDVAIPFLKERNITFYNPQVSQWDPSLIETEENAKLTCRVHFFVLDIYKTRGIASLVEAAYLSGQGRNLVLVVPKERPKTIKDIFEVKELDESEFQSINRSYLFIADLVQRQGIPLFTNVDDALKATRICLIAKCKVQDLTDIDKVIPVKHAYVNVSTHVRSLKKTFSELDPSGSGAITLYDVKSGLSTLFGCDISPISQTKDSFTFSDFCIEYSVILLDSIRRHQETPRSQSVDFSRRSTSLELVYSNNKVNTLRSVINIKSKLSTLEEVEFSESPVEIFQTKKKSLCRCRKINACITWMLKWPFSKISIITNERADQKNSRVSLRLTPQCLVGEEKYDIFLGGTCGNSDWREKIAIPIIAQTNCSYYDPKVSNRVWSRRLLPIEAQAREHSKVLVYVITSECTSTAALVEAAHFIGQEKKVLLHVQLLSSLCPTPQTSMNQFLQSSCSFPLSSLTNTNKSSFFAMHSTDSSTSGYHSNSNTSTSGILASNSQFSFPPLSNKLSISDSGQLSNIDDGHDLSLSDNNISRINPLPLSACNDHNRGRSYLIDLATRARVPIYSSIEETIRQAIKLSKKVTFSPKFAKK